MTCTITDQFVSLSGASVTGLSVTAEPRETPLFFAQGDGSYLLATADVLSTATSGTGTWTLQLPWPSQVFPGSVEWVITTPDGTRWAGVVPEGQVGPFRIYDLVQTYGWYEITDPLELPASPQVVVGPAGAAGLPGTGGPPYVNLLTYAGVSTPAAVSDWIPTIQNALNYVSGIGGGTVFAPGTGTYTVRPSSTNYITMPNNVSLLGEGPSSVLQVNAGNGNWVQLFKGTFTSGAKGHFLVQGLTFDSNIQNNTGSTVSGTNPQRVFFLADWADGITFRSCRFINSGGVHMLRMRFTGNTAQNLNTKVTGCHFHFLMNPSPQPDYDNTALYISGKYTVVSDNTFQTDIVHDVSGSPRGARTAIEIVSGPSIVKGNSIVGFRTGMFVGQSTTSEQNVFDDPGHCVCIGNSVSQCNDGIYVATPVDVTNYCGGVTCVGNQIDVSQVTHNMAYSHGIAIWRDSGYTGLSKDITISGNLIEFQDEVVGRTQGYGSGGTLTAIVAPDSEGINLHSYGDVEGVTVVGNTIVRAPAAAIGLGSVAAAKDCRNVHVAENVCLNPGQNLGIAQAARNGIYMSVQLTDVQVIGNHISDNWATTRCFNGAKADSASTYTRVHVLRNFLNSANTALLRSLQTGITTGDTWYDLTGNQIAQIDTAGHSFNKATTFTQGVAVTGGTFDSTQALTVDKVSPHTSGAELWLAPNGAGIAIGYVGTSPPVESLGVTSYYNGNTTKNCTFSGGTLQMASTGNVQCNTYAVVSNNTDMVLRPAGTGAIVLNKSTAGTVGTGTGAGETIIYDGATNELFRITAKGHIRSSNGTAPTLSAPATNVTASLVSGNDTRGTIQLIVAAGGVPINTALCTATFGTDRSSTPNIQFTAITDATATAPPLGTYYADQTTTPLHLFKPFCNAALTIGTYRLAYWVVT